MLIPYADTIDITKQDGYLGGGLMSGIINTLTGLHGVVIYLMVAGLVFAEAGLFFGFVFPGETAVVVGGLLASQGRVSLPWLVIIVVASAISGDSLGFEIGRKLGPRLLNVSALRRHRAGVERAQELIRRRGPAAVFFGRFVALLRALVPALAGSSQMHYPRFLMFNAAGGTVWGVAFCLGGYFAGTAFEKVSHYIGLWGGTAVGILAVGTIAVWVVRRRRREALAEAEAEVVVASVPIGREGDSRP